jgi:hypothetical protein
MKQSLGTREQLFVISIPIWTVWAISTFFLFKKLQCHMIGLLCMHINSMRGRFWLENRVKQYLGYKSNVLTIFPFF